MTAKYTYKGANINNLTSGSTNTTLSGYGGFPSYDSATPFSTERPLPFGIKQQGTDVSTKMNAVYINYGAGSSGKYTVPSDFTHFRAILEGGGGGGGGAGGEGQPSSNNGGGGRSGGDGEFLYVSDIPISQGTEITYSVGNGGQGGTNGSPATDLNEDDSAKGEPGSAGNVGGSTNIQFQTYQISAYGGSGGGGGNGGTSTDKGDTDSNKDKNDPASTYSTSSINPYTSDFTSSNINKLGYLSSYSNGGGQATDGQGGYLRIYLLRE